MKLVVAAVQLNATFYSCQVPSDLSDITPAKLDVRIGFNGDPKSTSHSNFQIHILDRCPPGYYCSD
jgi:hypothetical protein